MAIQAGLVGLPNVGKSTLFNALTKSSIPAANYPFCTVDPHLAITHVPDARLDKLAAIFSSQKIIPATVQFVDIAGLVKGASQGEGLGNQFLSNVMGVDVILHVLRCFEDSGITHVHNHVDPVDDFETIMTELCLKDLESVEKRQGKMESLAKKARNSGNTQEMKDLANEKELLEKVHALLTAGNFDAVRETVTEATIETVPLLTAKKYLCIANVSEDDFSGTAYEGNKHYQAVIERFGRENVIVVSAKIESELAQMDEDEAAEMMESLEITQTGLSNIIQSTYRQLGLMSFFTCGPKEAHAWPIRVGTRIPQAAGTIHSDMERGFICAEVYHCDDMIELKSEAALKSAGKVRTEGKEYIVTNGDVVLIRFNV